MMDVILIMDLLGMMVLTFFIQIIIEFPMFGLELQVLEMDLLDLVQLHTYLEMVLTGQVLYQHMGV
jgi:hypothetical protein